MPTQDTWSPQNGLPGPSFSGRIRTWVRTPNFGALPEDQKPVNPYTDRQIRISQDIRNQATYGSDGSLLTNNYHGYTDTGNAIYDGVMAQLASRPEWTSVTSGLANAVKLKALVKIADAKVNVAVAFAEASKTSDLILDAARRIDKAYRAFRRGDLKTVAQTLNITPKRLHKSWLEYKYGWMPLLMDVKGAAEFFAQQHVVRSPRFQVSATEEVHVIFPFNTTYAAFGGGQGTYERQFNCYRKVRVKIWCELSSPRLTELQQIGLTNPLLVAWELVPFSFVFDWFISVGDWLTGLTALQGVTIRRAMFSTQDSIGWNLNVKKTRYQSTFPVLGNIYVDDAWTVAMSFRGYTREPLVLNPLELYPPVKGTLNFSKLVTGLALIQGNYRGRDRTLRT
jgi:hypothetical protein